MSAAYMNPGPSLNPPEQDETFVCGHCGHKSTGQDYASIRTGEAICEACRRRELDSFRGAA